MDTAAHDPIIPRWHFDAALLRRYDRPGPRYTSYPTAPQFHDGFGWPQLREAIERAPAGPLSLYVHVPFCSSPCFYCGCNRVITRDRSRGAAYVARVLREASLIAPMLGDKREVVQLHLGGGTPNFLGPALIGELLRGLRQHFDLSVDPSRDFSIELDPRTLGSDELAELARLGFTRASLGVQDFDPRVQQAINRVQDAQGTLALIEACRAQGLRSVNVDLVYGLPRQTLDGFGATLERVLQARPDRFAIYGYAHLPAMFRAQRRINEAELPDADGRLALLGLAVGRLTAAGYQYIGMDHFALPGDELATAQREGSLHRNFMGYTTHAARDLLGLGASAISRIGGAYAQNPRELAAWEAAIDQGRVPVWRGLALSRDDEIRGDVIQALMCRGEIDTRQIGVRHGIDFAQYFAQDLPALEALRADGLVETDAGRVRATARGRPLLRLIAMCFDSYLRKPSAAGGFSRAI
ncbi:MAG TPA: oxygen-independent coproporphyrinogen III oxidase [Stenotrophomonas sp.]|nr:oxygen-independent coproporphyrinogen III oxidase [Stenotrophomonas sp.]